MAPVDALKNSIAQMQPQFKLALPSHIPPERFVRVLQTAISTNPDLVSADRNSVFGAAMKAAQEGLLPDGKEAAIVTFNTKVKTKGGGETWVKMAQYMPMVAGILKKVRNSGELGTIAANVVHKGDHFRYWVDQDGEHMEHKPDFFADDRGKRIGVYAMAKTKDGGVYIEVLNEKQVMDVKDVSRAKNSGPWASAFEDEMWRKSAIRRLSKRLPMSTDIEMAIHSDDELFNPPPPDETADETTAAPREVKTRSSRLADKMGVNKEKPADRDVSNTETQQAIETTAEQVNDNEVPI